MNRTQQNRWLLDAALFAGFLACFFLDWTGVAWHQWIGVLGGVLAAVHLATHWQWVKAVTERLRGSTSTRARLYYAIDALILVGFVFMLFTGLVISTWLNLSLVGYPAWRSVHVISSVATLLLVTIKIGLHARWILAAGRKPLANAGLPVGQASPASERRAFLRLMGVVSAASIFALGSSLPSLWESTQADQVQPSDREAVNSSTVSSSASSTTSTTSCSVRCGKRCAYPGHCGRYTDHNDNGRCDLGECQG